ncbi:MAG TPA: NAD(P)-dependent oxidoreductase [Candidatus Dormibacteraeota bacterium]|nr:NAD(P)-dependent oxidoreductase [Candidatus Dormibacteraeota bacterium]
MPVRIVCLSPYSKEQVEGLLAGRHAVDVVTVPDPPAPEAVLRECSLAELVIADKRHAHRLPREVLQHMTRCLLIQMPAVGYDVIDDRAAAEFGIAVANAAGYNRDAVADWTVMAILNLIRRGAWGDRRMREGAWPKPEMIGRELGALTIGLVGLGNVGSALAARLTAFGARVVYSDVVERSVANVERVSFGVLLELADVVCIHVPLNEETHHLIDAAALRRMQKGAYLINASRGPVVSENALIAALETGHLGGAALDVFGEEPTPADNPLRRMENVFLSPHVAGAALEAEARALEVVRDNLTRVLDGEEPSYVVNGVRLGARLRR